jgi:BirA family biotin operon repressor/biotin-[acetyl-CoA-carboxylase] ligase
MNDTADAAPVAILAESMRRLAPAIPDDWTLEVRASCASTNSELLERPGRDSRLLFALEQTAGRGRRGRGWSARPGDSLTFSVRHTFALRADALSGLSLAVGAALADALSARGVDGIALKWPNDLMRFGGKLGGVLIELSSPPDRSTTAVIGVGLNLAPPPVGAYAHTPAALYPQTPGRDDWLATAAALADALAGALPRFAEHGFAAFAERWNACNLHAGREVVVSGEHQALRGICVGADHDGALMIGRGGRVERVLAGDVSLRGAD